MSQFDTTVILNGKPVCAGRGLRGLMRYQRKSRVVAIVAKPCEKNPHNGRLTVQYADGAQCTTFFASYSVLLEWVANRHGWAFGVKHTICAPAHPTWQTEKSIGRLVKNRGVTIIT